MERFEALSLEPKAMAVPVFTRVPMADAIEFNVLIKRANNGAHSFFAASPVRGKGVDAEMCSEVELSGWVCN